MTSNLHYGLLYPVEHEPEGTWVYGGDIYHDHLFSHAFKSSSNLYREREKERERIFRLMRSDTTAFVPLSLSIRQSTQALDHNGLQISAVYEFSSVREWRAAVCWDIPFRDETKHGSHLHLFLWDYNLKVKSFSRSRTSWDRCSERILFRVLCLRMRH